MVSAQAASAGPLAMLDRAELSRSLANYLSLVEQGDARRLEYRTSASDADALDAVLLRRRATVRALALDELANLIGVELLVASTEGHAAEARIVFFRLAEGFIADTFLVEESARFLPGGGMAPRSPPIPANEPLPGSVRLSTMTPQKFRDYLDLFGRFDERFTEYYTPDVVFAASPAPAPLQGRDAVLQLYRPLRANLGENVTVHHLAIDNRAGLMMAALTNRLTAFGEVELPSRRLQPGDQFVLSGAIIYGLRGGKISLIRDVGG